MHRRFLINFWEYRVQYVCSLLSASAPQSKVGLENDTHWFNVLNTYAWMSAMNNEQNRKKNWWKLLPKKRHYTKFNHKLYGLSVKRTDIKWITIARLLLNCTTCDDCRNVSSVRRIKLDTLANKSGDRLLLVRFTVVLCACLTTCFSLSVSLPMQLVVLIPTSSEHIIIVFLFLLCIKSLTPMKWNNSQNEEVKVCSNEQYKTAYA